MTNIVNPAIVPASSGMKATTLLATPSSSVKVERSNNGAIAKVPVLVGKTIVQLYIEALADFDEPALEITNVKHDLNLTGCEFLQVESAKNGKLIINGFVRENIDYTSAKYEEDGTVSIGNRRTGMDIPFKCFTKFQLDSEPEASTSSSLFNSEEITALRASNNNYSHYSSSNEELSFEVVETKIRQVHTKRNTDNITINNYGEQTFSSLSINLAVDIAIMVFQNQFVEVSSSSKSSSNNQSGNSNSGNSSSNSGGNDSKGGKSSNSNENSKNSKDSKDSGKDKNKGDEKSKNKGSKYYWMKSFGAFGKMF